MNRTIERKKEILIEKIREMNAENADDVVATVRYEIEQIRFEMYEESNEE
ncbi:hypothetical protein ACYSNR_09275 [Enterococcus sp. LJL128]